MSWLNSHNLAVALCMSVSNGVEYVLAAVVLRRCVGRRVNVARVGHLAALVAAAPAAPRAAGLLASLERGSTTGPDLPLFASLPAAAPDPDPVQTALDRIEPDQLSPREALEALYQLKALALSSGEC